MPKSSKQRRGEIIYALRHEDLISDAKLRDALSDADIESPNGIKEYVAALVATGYLERTPGGFRLTAESRKTGTITIRVHPKQNTAAVFKGLDAALQQFRPLISIETEV